MNLEKFNPLNWFKDKTVNQGTRVPVNHQPTNARREVGNWDLLTPRGDRLFDDAFSGFRLPSLSQLWDWQPFGFDPQMALTEDGYTIRLSMPSIDPDQLSIDVDGRAVRVSGYGQSESRDSQAASFRYARVASRIERRFTLPTDADPDSLSAHWQQGVLQLSVRRSKPRRIPIRH